MAPNEFRHPAGLSAGTVNGPLAHLATMVGNLFQTTVPLEREGFSDRLTLLLIIVLGAYARFYALGSVGFHGDEETMALAVRHILVDGRPTLPSGMFYPRGITQLYLMAISAHFFGMNEWALRLPSAVCGVLLIPLTYWAGRRFLRPRWCLALAASVALLPEIVEYSQTARMYIFMLLAISIAMLCLFEWERSDRWGWLIGAVCALVIGLDYQVLCVTVALLFVLPGLMRGDLRKLFVGGAAAATVGVAFLIVNYLTASQYPKTAGQVVWKSANASVAHPYSFGALNLPTLIAIAIGAAIAVAAMIFLAKKIANKSAAIWCSILFAAGLGAQLALFYHCAALLYLSASVIAVRYSEGKIAGRLLLVAVPLLILTAVHVKIVAVAAHSPIQIVGALIGKPSVWPYVQAARMSSGASLILLFGTMAALVRLCKGEPIADYALLALLTVWIPVFALGFFIWNMPPRYAAASLIPLLMCAFAFAQRGSDWLCVRVLGKQVSSSVQLALALFAVVVVVNPIGSLAAIEGGYGRYPDHKGAAEFLRSQGLSANDVVLAEDVLEQTYYLGSVDAWLIGPANGRSFARNTPQGLRDIYTGTALVTSAAEFEAMLQRNAGKRIFIVGSGEDQSDHRRSAREPELAAILESERFPVIYLGRDKATRVWLASAGSSH